MLTQHRSQLDLPTKLNRVEQRSRQDRKAVFNNLGHLINLEMLEDCHHRLDGAKAVGVDGITKENYEEKLTHNLEQLLMKIRRGCYHPKPSRIVEIPKADGSMRPLAISCHEDKVVQEAVRRILERIYEPIFLNCSHGFRPRRSCDTALVSLHHAISDQRNGAVLEIDLRRYFDTIPHEPLLKLLRLKISDPRFLNLIIKLLKSPILEKDGRIARNEMGSPQGSILSPIIANLYLHYVIDVWFSWFNQSRFRRTARMVRYADDAVFVFNSLKAAQTFRDELTQRTQNFGISLHKDKTRLLPSGARRAAEYERQGLKMPSFTFLGFLHVWGKSTIRNEGTRYWRLKRRTCPKRFKKKLAAITAYIRIHRHDRSLPTHIARVVRGYLNYFAINDNGERCTKFSHAVRRILFKWLNRRSQRKSMTWERFSQVLEDVGYPSKFYLRNLCFVSRLDRRKPAWYQ